MTAPGWCDPTVHLGMTAAPTRPRRRRAPLCVALGLVAAGVASGGVVVLAGGSGTASAQLSWSVPDRVSPDGRTADVNPDSWPVDLDACDGGGGGQVRWRITGAALDHAIETTGGCRTRQELPAQGAYDVSATAGGTTVHTDVQVRDVLIVSVGDSVASGEGDPDRPAGVTHAAAWQDRQCHRSALAGPAQAALRLERRDPHTSVTFVPLACSGATIEQGLLGGYDGIDATGTPLPPQLDEAVRRAAGRPIDTLLISIGANDLGFGDIVRTCVLAPDCSTGGGAERYRTGLARLPGEFDRLAGRLAELTARGVVRAAVQTEYFDVATSDDGSTCPQPSDGDSQDGISRTEFAWTHDVVSPGLNAAVRAAVAASGNPRWRYLGGIAAGFARHGYCASDSWVRHASDSARMQHDLFGSFHPNERGQLLGYALRIEQDLARAERVGGTPTRVG